MKVVQISDYLPARQKSRPRQKSQYELYPLPFFNTDAGPCTWDVTPTGDYAADCETGRRYAIKFLRSCDGTVQWASLMGNITADMIRAGTNGTSANGRPKVNGIVIGFMSVIGRAVCASAALLKERQS
jgi:hypothetical protein